MKHNTVLAWIDLEMTGLSPEHDDILEVCLVVTDVDLNVLEPARNWVIGAQAETLNSMSNYVKQMHQHSGLYQDCLDSELTLSEVQDQLRQALNVYSGYDILLSGNSITTDRMFIRKHMQHIEELLHYRQIDVTSLKLLVSYWCPKLAVYPKVNKHRALDDIYESISELGYYQNAIFSKNNLDQ